MRNVNSLSFKSIGLLLCAGLVTVGLVIVTFNFYVHFQATESLADWQNYSAGSQQKNSYLGVMQRHLGGDTLEHEFEEYLRQENAEHLHHLQEALEDTEDAFRNYAAMPLNSKEQAALESIRPLVDRFSAALTSAKAQGGSESVLRERLQAMEEQHVPAGEALAVLQSDVSAALSANERDIEQRLIAINSFTLSSSIVMLVMLLMLTLGLLTTLRRVREKVGGEPDRILAIVNRMAKGDLSEELPETDADSGIYQSILHMQRNLRELTAEQKANAEKTLRLKLALDNASASVMVADDNNRIIYMNKAAHTLFTTAESEIRTRFPDFRAADIIGNSVDIFHADAAKNRATIEHLLDKHVVNTTLGALTIRLVVNPVFDEQGKRLGTITEWFDRTEELNNEKKVQELVEAAVRGD